MSDYIDLQQVIRLEGVLGPDLATIVAPMLTDMTEAIGEVEEAMAAGDLDRVTRAAHRCRNDALALGAHQLLRALTDLEAAARGYDESRATAALKHMREVWPPTRDELVATVKLP